MSALFSKSAISQAISAFQGHDLSREIAIVQELYDDLRKGNMKDETRYEQRFNDLFFGQLLDYESGRHRIPQAPTPVGGKRADVALGFFEDNKYSFESVKVMVEFKGSDTLLDKKQASYGGQSPVDQGFGYKTSFKDCPWLIVSNFASIRLYRDNKQDFEIWTIEQLADPSRDYYHLKTLLGLLKKNRLISQNDIPFTERILSEVRSKQEQITKDFYKEYKTLRFELINDIRHHNPSVKVEVVVEKAQKIIDRIIFIHFCEDKGLLPEGKLKTNVIRAREADFSPWDVLKRYFKGVDSGSEKLEIPHGYNGGLFHEDPILNNLDIGDTICHKFIDLGNYNFDDELSVNILGHIFEQSISDIEQLKVDLLGEEITTDELIDPSDVPSPSLKGKTKESKRKKDGIFYTPEYIVDYIIQNSLMVYLEEKENECLAKYKKENEAYQAYQHILHNIKVLDPACGSGAFLVKVFDYLYTENKRVGEIVGGLFSTDEVYKSILRNNIYGVDLNPESVEITKLSLWLKSAQKGKKLNNLDDNIKCGNSLIDDPAVAGERAFDRKKEFSDIMSAGGFDVIVGNPPYVNANDIKKSNSIQAYNFLKNNYETAKGTVDLYIYFFERGLKLLKENGILSYITPNRFLSASYGVALREFILDSYQIISFMDYSDKKVFPDASTYPVISFIKNNKTHKYTLSSGKFDENTKEPILNNFTSDKLTILDENIWGFLLNDKITITQKVFSIGTSLSNSGKINATSTAKEAEEYSKLINNNEIGVKLINTGTIDPYISLRGKSYLTDKGKKILNPKIDITNQIISENRKSLYLSKKIIISKIGLKCEAFLDKEGEYASINTNCIHSFSDKALPEYILCWLNSKLYNYTFECLFDGLRMSGGYLLYSAPNLKNTSIKIIPLSDQQPFIDKADLMLSLNKELHEKIDFVLRFISNKFGLDKLSTKLSKFYDYDFATFLKELKGSKLSMTEEAELMEFFEAKKKEIVSFKNRIDTTDREIDEMVFELYGLSKEEKKVVLDS